MIPPVASHPAPPDHIWHALTPQDALQALGTDAEIGLTAAQALRLHARYGANELPQAPPVPLWRALVCRVHCRRQSPLAGPPAPGVG